MPMLPYVLTAVIAAVIAGAIGAILSYVLRSRGTREQEKSAQTLLDEAKRSTESARKEAEVKARGFRIIENITVKSKT